MLKTPSETATLDDWKDLKHLILQVGERKIEKYFDKDGAAAKFGPDTLKVEHAAADLLQEIKGLRDEEGNQEGERLERLLRVIGRNVEEEKELRREEEREDESAI